MQNKTQSKSNHPQGLQHHSRMQWVIIWKKHHCWSNCCYLSCVFKHTHANKLQLANKQNTKFTNNVISAMSCFRCI